MKPVVVDDARHIFSKVPFMQLLDVKREYSAGGRARLVVEARPELGNVIGAVHGGVVATLVDVAMASAAVSTIDFRQTAVTLNLTTSFLEPGEGRLVADGEFLHDDGGVAWCRAVVTDARDRVVARAQGSFRFVPLPRGDRAAPQEPQKETP